MSRAPVDVEKLKELHAKGLDDPEIAKAMGIHLSTVWKMRDKISLSRNHTRRQKATTFIDDKPNPLEMAKVFLGKRLTEQSGCYRLDGQPASLDRIMREYNRLLKQGGYEQVGIERWRM